MPRLLAGSVVTVCHFRDKGVTDEGENTSDFQMCYAGADAPEDCKAQAEDYLECLHHKKEVSPFTLRAAWRATPTEAGRVCVRV